MAIEQEAPTSKSVRFKWWEHVTKGETVYSVGAESSYMSVGILKNLKLRKEDCQLVCNADRSIVGYIPISHFVGYVDEDVLKTVKKCGR